LFFVFGLLEEQQAYSRIALALNVLDGSKITAVVWEDLAGFGGVCAFCFLLFFALFLYYFVYVRHFTKPPVINLPLPRRLYLPFVFLCQVYYIFFFAQFCHVWCQAQREIS